ncbi:Actin-binding LIM protein 3 [Homalodisca vitripennis]|nr:Actin-binding LIM protein 3 [Homalodisca vitripennis]
MCLVTVVSALRHVPKPGYGLAPRSHTFSSTAGSATPGDFSFSGLGEKTHSTDFSSGKSDSKYCVIIHMIHPHSQNIVIVVTT